MKKQELTTKKMLGYCCGDIFGGGAFALVGALFLAFLTDTVQIKPWIAGIMLLIGKFWDAVIDPFIGDISEKICSKKGKRRVFFLAGIFHIAACFTCLWLPFRVTDSTQWLGAIYYTLAYMLFATSFSMTMVPYHAMLPELTDDVKKRNKTVAIRSIFSSASAAVSTMLPPTLIKIFTNMGTSSSWAYLFMGLVFGVIYSIPWIIVFFSTKGIDLPQEGNKEFKIGNPFKSFLNNGKVVFKNRSFRKFLGLYLLSYTATDIFMALLVYYVKWYMGIYGVFKYFGFLGAWIALLGAYMIAQLIAIPFYKKLADKKGKRTAFITSMIIWISACIITVSVVNPTIGTAANYILLGCAFLLGIGGGGTTYIPWAMLPETMDVEEVISGERKDGIYAGFQTFIRQLSQGVALLLVGLFLDFIDEDLVASLTSTICTAEEGQYACILENLTPAVKTGIRIFTLVGPAVCFAGSLAVTISYPIKNKNYLLIKKQLNEADKLTSDEKTELEKLAGHPYEKLYK